MSPPAPPSSSLETAARAAAAAHPGSDLELALDFVVQAGAPEAAAASSDRLLVAGRRLRSLLALADEPCEGVEPVPLELCLERLLEEMRLLVSGEVKVPTVPFGTRTGGLQMPIVTLGCMRFQEEWGPRIDKLNMVGTDCQENLVQILRTAHAYGITHIETARGYGSSELQLGAALRQLRLTGEAPRADWIIQSKVGPNKDLKAFEAAVEASLANLRVDYLDLFAFHGMNFPEQLDWVFGTEGNLNATEDCRNCWDVIQKFQRSGRIRHIGFSTHGSADLIADCIKRDCFDYVNLHYHFCGSYTASGGGPDGAGNRECLRLAEERGMGIFVISPFDKGGRLYAPSRRLRALTLPEHEPMAFHAHWLWSHHELEGEGDGAAEEDRHTRPRIHTFTVGAGRPSDLDVPAVQAHLWGTRHAAMLERTRSVARRLDAAAEAALGREWLTSWWRGLPKAAASKHHVEHNQIVWIYNCIQAWGMYEFGRARYNSFEKNGEKWSDALTPEENIDKMGRIGWGFVPGLPLRLDVDYEDDLVGVPAENRARVAEALAFVYRWCRDPHISEPLKPKNAANELARRHFSVSAQMMRLPSMTEAELLEPLEEEEEEDVDDAPVPPVAWTTSYDMRPWPDYPDRPQRDIGK